MTHTLVGRDAADTRAAAVRAYADYARSNLVLQQAHARGVDQDLQPAESDVRALALRAAERMVGGGLVGGPDQCRKRLAELRAAGADEVACLIDFGVPADRVLAGVELLAELTGVKDYAMMLHKAHGKNLGASLQLGQKIGVTPMETSDVDKFRVKGAGELAALIPLDGNDFEGAYLDAMIQGHTEVLKMIDDQLLPSAKDAALQAHLKTTRNDVAQHLEKAKQLKGDGKR